MWFLTLSLFLYWITLMYFHILNHPCIPGMVQYIEIHQRNPVYKQTQSQKPHDHLR